jgi:hypothetical protein
MARDDHCLDLGHLGQAQDLIAVEIQLCHAPVLYRALAVERRAEPVGHRALDLRGDLVGIDRVAAVERQHHAVHLHLALAAH